MQLEPPSASIRPIHRVALSADLVVVGGGLAGVCAAINAARSGLRVILVQDRTVLGGNSSSEVRLWALGATSHMANNNRWSREGGLVDELLVENTHRNPEGNTIFWDALLLEKVRAEPLITLLLNTAVDSVEKSAPDRIAAATAYCAQNETRYHLAAPLFCDASGDGIVGFQAGAAFRMGAEKPEEFDEGFAPDESYGQLLGHTIYFYSKDTGQPVRYTPPAFALQDITKIPRFKNIRAHHTGCNFWWIEYGGRRDTIHETEEIKWELWSIVYGIWHYIKNSGQFPEAANLTLEWVGTIPGKRESRRFEGDYIITQRDVIDQVVHPDAVATGGWSLDLHPSDGIYTEKSPCNQYHSKGVYGIPYRCFYSRNIANLFLAGRIISASHVAFGSTRVMLTCAHGGAAVGIAAAHCHRDALQPRDLTDPARMATLQDALNAIGQSIPGVPARHPSNLTVTSTLDASSTWSLDALPGCDAWWDVQMPIAQLVPWEPGYATTVTIRVRVSRPGTLRAALRFAENPCNYTPEITAETHTFDLAPGDHTLAIPFDATGLSPRYGFLTFSGDSGIAVELSDTVATGLVGVIKKVDPKVSVSGEQIPPPGIGIDRFEFWIPLRRPEGRNLAIRLDPPLSTYAHPEYLFNGYERPYLRSNAWVADPADPAPVLTLTWPEPRTFSRITLCFDTDFDHALETSQWRHPESTMPHCVREFSLHTAEGRTLARVIDNHQTRRTLTFEPVTTTALTLRLQHPSSRTPAALFALLVE